MGANGNGPKPYTQRQARTVFLRVPTAEWPAVKLGTKTEFRASAGIVSGLKWVEPPTPVVAYCYRPTSGHEKTLMVLEERWQEPLGSISPESLKREGFESLAEFRRAWCLREKRRFPPFQKVTVYRVRLWQPEDREVFADQLLERLYGEHLPQDAPKAFATG